MYTVDEMVFFRHGEDPKEMAKIMKNQKTLTDLAPFLDRNICNGPINGRVFHPFESQFLKEAFVKPDGGLRGFARFWEFLKDEEKVKEEFEEKKAEKGRNLSREEENDIRAADGIKIFLVHVLETVPKEPETDVDFPPTLPSLDPDKFILLAESTAEKPWTFTSVFHPDMLPREYWKQTIRHMANKGAENVTEVNEDTMTFEWRTDVLFSYSLVSTVDSITRPGQKRKREDDYSDSVKKHCANE